LSSWWKVQITGTNSFTSRLKKGDILYAKNGEKFITLFDGQKEFTLPKMNMQKIKPLNRVDRKMADDIERNYQNKVKNTAQPSPFWEAEEEWKND